MKKMNAEVSNYEDLQGAAVVSKLDDFLIECSIPRSPSQFTSCSSTLGCGFQDRTGKVSEEIREEVSSVLSFSEGGS